MIYHVNMLINGKPEIMIVEYTAQEYGISEQSFWSCWLADSKHINGDGDTFEQAVQDMVKNKEHLVAVKNAVASSLERFFVGTVRL